MQGPTTGDLQSLLTAIHQINGCRTRSDFAKTVVQTLTNLIGSDRTDLQVYGIPDGCVTLYRDHHLPGDQEREAYFLEHLFDHPLVVHNVNNVDTGPAVLSDHVDLRSWKQTEMYDRCCRELEHDYLMASSMPAGEDGILSISFDRRLADFGPRERALLGLAHSHIAQAWKNVLHFEAIAEHVAGVERGLDALGSAVVVLGEDDSVETVTQQADRLLGFYFDDWTGRQLPRALRDWLGPYRKTSSPPPTPFDTCVGSRRLTVRMKPDSASPRLVLSLKEHSPHDDVHALQKLGLTTRQAEVLYWLMQGKSNPEMAIILSVRPRTVDKFVENILLRLGVESRLAAALHAREWLGK